MNDDIGHEHTSSGTAASLHDFEPSTAQFRDELLAGLRRSRKEVPCKYLYDQRGSQLFDAICEVYEYYPTRTEMQIMEERGAEMAELLGSGCLVIEYGSGSSTKTPILLKHLRQPVAYVPIDISREHLLESADRLKSEFPHLKILPVCADYTAPFELPEIERPATRRVVYYPGSTIGNFHPDEAAEFLHGIARVCGPGGGLLLGVDLRKSREVLEAAYNDGAGMTAEFNLNLLHRINQEIGADFEIEGFEHEAVYNDEHSRIEMHLVSQRNQRVTVGGEEISFRAGESILTECSYKYSYEGFAGLASTAGFDVERVWTDSEQLFSVQYLMVA